MLQVPYCRTECMLEGAPGRAPNGVVLAECMKVPYRRTEFMSGGAPDLAEGTKVPHCPTECMPEGAPGRPEWGPKVGGPRTGRFWAPKPRGPEATH